MSSFMNVSRKVDEAIFGKSITSAVYGPGKEKMPAPTTITPSPTIVEPTADDERKKLSKRKSRKVAALMTGGLGELSLSKPGILG